MMTHREVDEELEAIGRACIEELARAEEPMTTAELLEKLGKTGKTRPVSAWLAHKGVRNFARPKRPSMWWAR